MYRRRFNFEEEENILIEQATRSKIWIVQGGNVHFVHHRDLGNCRICNVVEIGKKFTTFIGKEEELHKKIVQEKTYKLRVSLMGKYFIRLSTINKEKLILQLLDNCSDSNNFLEIANFISIGDAKPYVYTLVYHQTDFKFDKCLFDHNRCLDEKTLQEAMENDIVWFQSLTSDQQVDVIIRLIKHGGGYIQRNLFLPLLKKCVQQKKFRSVGTDTKEVESQDSDDESTKVRYYESRDTIVFADHPATVDVENQRKNWNQIISKYREKVQGIKQELKEKPKKDKKVKASKDGKDVVSTDWIQLLPVWTVKKIFNHFDQKTLQKLKKVNSYWAYVVQDVIKERKMRTQLDKEIETLKTEIGPKVLAEDLEMEQMQLAVTEKAPKQKGRRINYELGAIVKKLVPKPTNTMVRTSLIAEVMKGVTEDYFTEHLASFPREPGKETTMYKYQPCFLRDVNLVLGDQEDINEVKSFVTYSLDTPSGSITLPVDRQTLEDW